MKKDLSFSILTVFFIFMLFAFSAIMPSGKGRYIASGKPQFVGYVAPELAQK